MLKPNYNIVGVMSGTSLDGIDIIHTSFVLEDYWKFKIHHTETVKYSNKWKAILSQLVSKSLNDLEKIDVLYSEYLASKILDFIQKYNIENLDFIASHGHTALHQPEKRLTYQIGNRQELADNLKEKIICDFRVEDVELGGQGAPLVPIGDKLLFYDYDYCLNLGGFANISYDSNNQRIAFDICPVNIVLNHYVSRLSLDYDDKGHLAKTGEINTALLSELNALNFYKEAPPKSLGLEWVKENCFPIIESYNLNVENILRTFIEHIAIQISKVLDDADAKVLVTGGGVYNEFLLDRIKNFTRASIVLPSSEIIEFKEALVFGLLGVLKERNEINCLKSVTGATEDHSSGKILIPNI
jgi:anhydro-N-acetylmuramic acid kinase